jgi:hypothetical protein
VAKADEMGSLLVGLVKAGGKGSPGVANFDSFERCRMSTLQLLKRVDHSSRSKTNFDDAFVNRISVLLVLCQIANEQERFVPSSKGRL